MKTKVSYLFFKFKTLITIIRVVLVNEGGKRYTDHSNEPIEDEGSGGVVSPIMEGWNALVFPGLETFLEIGFSAWVQCTDRL